MQVWWNLDGSAAVARFGILAIMNTAHAKAPEAKASPNSHSHPFGHHPRPHLSEPASAIPYISLEDGIIEHSADESDALLPLFDSFLGQLFWKNCERVSCDGLSSVVISPLKFAEIVSDKTFPRI
jgi:hypothetical protein